jgi:hypothetical protein
MDELIAVGQGRDDDGADDEPGAAPKPKYRRASKALA